MKPKKKEIQKKLQFNEHLSELVTRFYWCIGSFVLGSILGYLNYNFILNWLISPCKRPLYYTSPTGGFESVLNIAIFSGIIFAFPVLVFNLIKFIQPVNPKLENKKFLIYLFISFALSLLGILLSYYVVFPASLNFFDKFGSNQLGTIISTKDYFLFITKYLLGFALFFQLPLAIYFLSLFIKITPRILFKKIKYVIAVSFLVAAILTPTPDIVNQSIMAAPIIFLYLLSILTIYIKEIITK